MTESKSAVLPLHHTPMLVRAQFILLGRSPQGGEKGAITYFAMLSHSKKENGVSEGTRTLGLQSHNLTR